MCVCVREGGWYVCGGMCVCVQVYEVNDTAVRKT